MYRSTELNSSPGPPSSLQPCPERGVPYQPRLRLTWAWGEGLRRGHKGTCLGGTPWAGRSSTSAARCCCHCYSKSLCLDHCDQRKSTGTVRSAQSQSQWESRVTWIELGQKESGYWIQKYAKRDTFHKPGWCEHSKIIWAVVTKLYFDSSFTVKKKNWRKKN